MVNVLTSLLYLAFPMYDCRRRNISRLKCCFIEKAVCLCVGHLESYYSILIVAACMLVLGTGYGPEIDWWSLGIVSFELLTGWPPFYDREFNRMCEKILSLPVRLTPPFKPPLGKSVDDTRNFDTEFTKLSIEQLEDSVVASTLSGLKSSSMSAGADRDAGIPYDDEV